MILGSGAEKAMPAPELKPRINSERISGRRVCCLDFVNILQFDTCGIFVGAITLLYFRNLISTMSEKSILSVEHLSKFFKSGGRDLSVLHDISFSIEEGGSCAVVGPSGS